MSEDQKSLKQMIEFRLDKLNNLRGQGVNPYPPKYDYTHKSNLIKTDYSDLEGKTVRVAGRIMAIRKMGKASFAQIMDSMGRIQFFIRRDDVGKEISGGPNAHGTVDSVFVSTNPNQAAPFISQPCPLPPPNALCKKFMSWNTTDQKDYCYSKP